MMTMVAIAQAATQQVATGSESIGAGALGFMLVSMGAVTLLAVWCFSRILGGKKHFDPDGTGPAKPPVRGEVEREGRQPEA